MFHGEKELAVMSCMGGVAFRVTNVSYKEIGKLKIERPERRTAEKIRSNLQKLTSTETELTYMLYAIGKSVKLSLGIDTGHNSCLILLYNTDLWKEELTSVISIKKRFICSGYFRVNLGRFEICVLNELVFVNGHILKFYLGSRCPMMIKCANGLIPEKVL